jgi:hypothetical protein
MRGSWLESSSRSVVQTSKQASILRFNFSFSNEQLRRETRGPGVARSSVKLKPQSVPLSQTKSHGDATAAAQERPNPCPASCSCVMLLFEPFFGSDSDA